MQRAVNGLNSNEGGVQVHGGDNLQARRWFQKRLKELGVSQYVKSINESSSTKPFRGFQVHATHAQFLAPDGDTSGLCQKLNLDTTHSSDDLEREILIAMLLCPIPFQFPTYDELMSSVRIRKNIVQAARKTALSFAAYEAERPEEFWRYDEDRGFVLRPGQPLIAALRSATQPDVSGKRFTFSCRRAVEYVMLLSMASEAEANNSELFQQLHHQAESRALKGREFEQIFLRTFGSQHHPLPVKFFIPGDRTWFRNPDEASSQATGYEGSWTFYLGNGVFADFWRQDRKFSLVTKCLTIYHWRNAVYLDQDGEAQINEQQVEDLVEATLQDPLETTRILQEMLRLQDPLDSFTGGCIEAHREHARQICPETADLYLPDLTAMNIMNVLSS